MRFRNRRRVIARQVLAAFAAAALLLVVPAPASAAPPVVDPTLAVDVLPGTVVTQPLRLADGTTADAWGSHSGMPTGFTLPSFSNSFTVSSTVPVGRYTFTLFAYKQQMGNSLDQTVTVRVGYPLAVPGTATVSWPVGQPGTVTLTPTAGNGPYAASAAALPAAWNASATGSTITATPTTAGTSTVTVRTTDAVGFTADTVLTVVSGTPPVLPATTALAQGVVGQPYAQTVLAPAGTGPFTWTVAGGALPGGLTLDPSTGALQGTPTAAGTGSVAVRATSTWGQATTTVTVPVVPAPTGTPTVTVLAPDSVVRIGQTFTSAAPTVQGMLPATWSIGSGALPPGVGLDPATGVVSGVPGRIGYDAWTVVATAAGRTASAGMSLATVDTAPAPGQSASVQLAARRGDQAGGAAVTATAAGLLPGSPWTVWMQSTPVLLAGGSAGADGSMATTTALPVGVEAGGHRTYLAGTARDGSPVLTQVWFAVGTGGRVTGVSATGPVRPDADPTAPARSTRAAPSTGAATTATPSAELVAQERTPAPATTSAVPSSPGGPIGSAAAPPDGVLTPAALVGGVAGSGALAVLVVALLRRRRDDESGPRGLVDGPSR